MNEKGNINDMEICPHCGEVGNRDRQYHNEFLCQSGRCRVLTFIGDDLEG